MNYSRIDHELIFGTRFVHELNRINGTINGQLMGQLMGINGETFLAGSAPRKNWERTQEKLGAHPGKTRSAPRKNWERTLLKH